MQKSAKLLGLGPDAVIAVPTDARAADATGALVRAELDRCRQAGLVVMAVVATAGTTDFGSIDPLHRARRDLRGSTGVWLHVDAAYGCGLLVSPTRRHLLDGIERADSVTVDFHKSFFQPVSSSALLVRDRPALRHVTYHADYLNPARMVRAAHPQPGRQEPPDHPPLRRAEALADPADHGRRTRVGALFDEVVDRAADAWHLLGERPALRGGRPAPQLSTLVFRYLPAGPGRRAGRATGQPARPGGARRVR